MHNLYGLFYVLNVVKDKWQSLYSNYKKLKDYREDISNNEDYFGMTSKYKDLYIPPDMLSMYFNKLDKFLSQIIVCTQSYTPLSYNGQRRLA